MTPTGQLAQAVPEEPARTEAEAQAGPGQPEELLIEEISIDGMCGVY